MDRINKAFDWGFGLVCGATSMVAMTFAFSTVIWYVSNVTVKCWSGSEASKRLSKQNNSCVIKIFGSIDSKMLREIQLQLNTNKHNSIDLIIDSIGGDVVNVLAIASLLHDFAGEVRTWIPFRAYSGATLIALSMISKGPVTVSPLAFFSPVDPIQKDDDHRHSLTGYRTQLDMLKCTKTAIVNHDIAVASELKIVANNIQALLEKHTLPLINDKLQKKQLLDVLLTGDISHESQIITPKLLQSLGLPIQIHAPPKFPQQIFDICHTI